MTKKTNLGPHAGTANNAISFEAAHNLASTSSDRGYLTTGNHAPFTAHSSIATKGNHPGERVIIFKTNGIEFARAYECCWGHKTNCNSTHIDCYTEAIG